MMGLIRMVRLGAKVATWAAPHVKEINRLRTLNEDEAWRNLELGQCPEAEKFFRLALGEKHTPAKRLELTLGLADAQRRQGKLEPAEQSAQAAIGLAGETKNHSAHLDALDILTDLQLDRGNPKEALELADRIVRLEDSRPKPDPARQVKHVHKLASVLVRNQKGEAALTAYARAAKQAEHTFGMEHPTTADVLSGWGALLRLAGRHEESQKMLRQAMQVHRETRGPDSREVTADISELAASLEESGDSAAAMAEYEKALTLRERQLGGDPHETALLQVRLGALYLQEGRSSTARELLIHAIRVLEKGDEEHYLLALKVLAYAEEFTGRGEEADRLREKAERVVAKKERAARGEKEPDQREPLMQAAAMHPKSDMSPLYVPLSKLPSPVEKQPAVAIQDFPAGGAEAGDEQERAQRPARLPRRKTDSPASAPHDPAVTQPAHLQPTSSQPTSSQPGFAHKPLAQESDDASRSVTAFPIAAAVPETHAPQTIVVVMQDPRAGAAIDGRSANDFASFYLQQSYVQQGIERGREAAAYLQTTASRESTASWKPREIAAPRVGGEVVCATLNPAAADGTRPLAETGHGSVTAIETRREVTIPSGTKQPESGGPQASEPSTTTSVPHALAALSQTFSENLLTEPASSEPVTDHGFREIVSMRPVVKSAPVQPNAKVTSSHAPLDTGLAALHSVVDASVVENQAPPPAADFLRAGLRLPERVAPQLAAHAPVSPVDFPEVPTDPAWQQVAKLRQAVVATAVLPLGSRLSSDAAPVSLVPGNIGNQVGGASAFVAPRTPIELGGLKAFENSGAGAARFPFGESHVMPRPAAIAPGGFEYIGSTARVFEPENAAVTFPDLWETVITPVFDPPELVAPAPLAGIVALRSPQLAKNITAEAIGGALEAQIHWSKLSPLMRADAAIWEPAAELWLLENADAVSLRHLTKAAQAQVQSITLAAAPVTQTDALIATPTLQLAVEESVRELAGMAGRVAWRGLERPMKCVPNPLTTVQQVYCAAIEMRRPAAKGALTPPSVWDLQHLDLAGPVPMALSEPAHHRVSSITGEQIPEQPASLEIAGMEALRLDRIPAAVLTLAPLPRTGDIDRTVGLYSLHGAMKAEQPSTPSAIKTTDVRPAFPSGDGKLAMARAASLARPHSTMELAFAGRLPIPVNLLPGAPQFAVAVVVAVNDAEPEIAGWPKLKTKITLRFQPPKHSRPSPVSALPIRSVLSAPAKPARLNDLAMAATETWAQPDAKPQATGLLVPGVGANPSLVQAGSLRMQLAAVTRDRSRSPQPLPSDLRAMLPRSRDTRIRYPRPANQQLSQDDIAERISAATAQPEPQELPQFVSSRAVTEVDDDLPSF